MGKKQQYKINGQTFSSQAELFSFVEQMLGRYRHGQRIGAVDAEFLFALVRRHPNVEGKIGCGIQEFFVSRATEHETKCFWILRKDGTTTDFSYLKCIRPESLYTQFQAACRTAVLDQILAFKDRRFRECRYEVKCDLTGKPVVWEHCHVDHDPPFRDLVAEFIRITGIDVGKVALKPPCDGSTQDEIEDASIAQAFSEFHRQRAGLRIVAERDHLRLCRGQRSTSGTDHVTGTLF